ncbi:MAG: ABC transporter permease [Chitinophagales bacterium]|nr:ABC transporter permease [Chitinophagales bacterium]
MLQHYLKIALRNFSRQRSLALINVFGLSIGLACFILFLLYAVNEFTFDRFHAGGENIFRVYRWSAGSKDEPANGSPYMPIPLGPAMKAELPGVLQYARMAEGWSDDFTRVNGVVLPIPITYADPSIFKIFSFRSKEGNLFSSLDDAHHVVLSASAAKKLFGSEDPMGKTVEIKVDKAFEPFIVSAVSEDAPSNSTIQFQVMVNFQAYLRTDWGKQSENEWHHFGYITYLQLQPGSHLPNDQKRLDNLYSEKYPDEMAKLKESSWKGSGIPTTYKLMPIRDMHTTTQVAGSAIGTVDPKNIWILLAIAASILIIACINFTTLAIGRSAGRAKEVGIRKVIGSRKNQLIGQFMIEAILLSALSSAIGILLGRFFLPYFNQLAGSHLAFSFQQFPEMIWMLMLLILLVGILAGSYPALVLSGFRPIEVLKQKMRLGGSNIFTKSLVTFQFILSAGLIISTLIILQQLKYLRSANPGFNKENVELSLGEGTGWSISSWDDMTKKHHDVYEYFVDPNYLQVLGLQLLAGRNFDPHITSDTLNSVIINETMMKNFGWAIQNAVGQQLKGYSENFIPTVIGVVKDFHYLSFSEEVKPEMFHEFHGYAPYKYFVRIQPGDPSKALAEIKSAWTSSVADLPFRYSLLDENLDRFYKSEARWSSIVGLAGALCIFLACLGLLGLAALAAVNRTREITIRKVLGASVSNIVALLSKGFLSLVFVALLIASPVAWYFMNKWLQNYAYRIDISWTVFIATGICGMAIAFFTVSSQAVKVALANPVKGLRAE